MLLPNTPYEAGRQLMETLRESIGSCPFHFKGERVAITLSAGLTAFVIGDTAERAFERADRALYRARTRDAIVSSQPDRLAWPVSGRPV